MNNRHHVLLNEMMRADELGGILDEKALIAGRSGAERRTLRKKRVLETEKEEPKTVCERIGSSGEGWIIVRDQPIAGQEDTVCNVFK